MGIIGSGQALRLKLGTNPLKGINRINRRGIFSAPMVMYTMYTHYINGDWAARLPMYGLLPLRSCGNNKIRRLPDANLGAEVDSIARSYLVS